MPASADSAGRDQEPGITETVVHRPGADSPFAESPRAIECIAVDGGKQGESHLRNRAGAQRTGAGRCRNA
ncbi:hypothetical protein GCM10010503_66520 [Streptomyces lucensis JCM 4490]|uniref:Uncharacterized protein n=1 Tax=Streptomyces lucensis JCM 4490 TaxID=1306176 RepID=A0A918JGY6_9ACTN|nr:hypothetical protein GCM10010503_66520 [Streptomyces lucensis JCM 4490]